jgi:hypothetical protein
LADLSRFSGLRPTVGRFSEDHPWDDVERLNGRVERHMGIFGHKDSQTAGEVQVALWCESYKYNVVGESHYRDGLLRVIAAASPDERDAGEVYTLAVLQQEPTNKYDENAVRVLIDGEVVGYVPREDAAALGKMVSIVDGSGGQFGAGAVIGWSTYRQDAPIGVRLDLPGRDDGQVDIKLRPLSELDEFEPQPASQRTPAPPVLPPAASFEVPQEM